jgi:biotin operon repressor
VTADETATLLFTLMRGEPCSGADIADALNCSPRRAYTVIEKLRRHGCIARARHGSWIITERGRLACALAMRRSTDAGVLNQAR